MDPLKMLEFIGTLARLMTHASDGDKPVVLTGIRYMMGLLTRVNLSTYGADPLISQNLGKLLSLCQALHQPDTGSGERRGKLLSSIEEVLKGLQGARGFGLKLS